MLRRSLRLILGSVILASWLSHPAAAANPINVAQGNPGELPKADDGRALNFDFERGTLDDWTAAGEAFKGQPIKGEIDPKRVFGEGKKAEHTGEFWIGGFEKLFDIPKGTLTSATFKVTHPYASFLLGGGRQKETRVELVNAADKKVFFTISGVDQENLRPVIVDLRPVKDQRIFIRLADELADGWGHLNFDDFRFHKEEPKFHYSPLNKNVPEIAGLYPFGGLEPEAAARAMRLPAGFSVQVAAAEPDVQQPIAMAFDHRGRLWIAEAFEYPRRAAEGKGRDRILILEDTDGDGKLDKRKVFAEKLNLVSGMEVGFGGVFVGAPPYLQFIPDADGDDVADGEPQILLDGFGYKDTHETLNTFTWGPDGWLYGCHGVFTESRVGKPGTADDARVPINAGIWRYHPTAHKFEVFAEGTSNPWGIDFNDFGQAFITACVIPHLFHVIQGARYERQAGASFNLHTYDDIKTIADHLHYTGNQWNDVNRRESDELGGGHAHAGAMIYLGGSWPERYRDQIFMNNIHGNRINQDRLAVRGSGYVGSHGPDFILTRDQSSQILNLRYGPDGQVWMIDWYDKNQCHDPDVNRHDRSNGRVFRVSYQDAKPVQVDLTKLDDAKLVELQTHKNDWYVRHARRLLQERAAAKKLAPATRDALAKLAVGHADETRRLRGLWALHVTGGVPADLAARLLADASPYVRGWMIQLMTEDSAKPPASDTLTKFETLARDDDSPIVRLYLTSALSRLPLAGRWPILGGLLTHDDSKDHNLPLMVWYAAEPLAGADAPRALALALSAGKRFPRLADFMVRRIGAGDKDKSLALLVAGLAESKDDAGRLTFLRGINESLQGKRQLAAPSGWEATYKKLGESESSEVRLQATALALSFGNATAADTLRKLVIDAKTNVAARRQAIVFLVRAKDAGLPAVLQGLLADIDLRGDALRSLAAFDDERTPAAVLTVFSKLPPAERRDALGTLCSRPAYAQALLAAIDTKQMDRSQLTADLVRQLRNLNDAELNKRIEQVWGTVRETAADKVRLIDEYKRLVASDSGQRPDLELGRAVFAKTCQQCHMLFGSGGKIGPDLTGSNRANLDYTLSNVVDPSAVMAKDYQASVVQLADGRVLTGIVKPGEGAAISVQTANELVTVAKSDIESQKLSDKSMMPDDQLKPMSQHEVRSLLAYVASPGQTALLANDENAATFFNGKDLALWRGEESLWSVEDGQIVGRTKGLAHNSFLISELAAEDFRLTLEVRLTKNEGNSGVQFRSQPLADGKVKGMQADVGVGWWGKLYEEEGRGLLWDHSGEAHVKPDGWNKYEIVAVGSRVRTWINGQPCVDLDDSAAARRGVIALQLHSGGPTEVRFRNLQLKLITRPTVPAGAFPTSKGGAAKNPITFKKHVLEPVFRSEGVGYGDFNNDGLLDIAAGSVWFEAPAWKMHSLLDKPNQFSPRTYSDTFCNWAEDLNGDGRQDLIVVDFPGKPTWWFENPGLSASPWKRRQIVPMTNNESPTYLDVDGDGRRELVLGVEGQRMGLARPTENAEDDWKFKAISTPRSPGTDQFSHGLGVGDMNGDGRLDVVIPEGWWEHPEPGASGTWRFHPAKLGEPSSQMYVFDFDGDGDADVLSSSAHRLGIWWHEQKADGWQTHQIDDSFAQTHAMCLADINGDGLPDFVTGKRHFAHNGNDPGEDKPAMLYWYELARKNGAPVWTPHKIDDDSGVGTQFEVVDMNGDGLLDVITSNKKGTHYFEQVREGK